MKVPSFLQASGLKGAYHIRDLLRNDIGGTADHSDCTNRHKWQRERIIAGQDGECRWQSVPEQRNPLAVASSFLDRNDVRAFPHSAATGLDCDLPRAPTRYI